MPQTFQVLRCFKCLVFQVHQTKKSNKWECKLCGEKQSIKRHYGLGTAKDCRIHVQKLNGLRGEMDELKRNQDQHSDDSENEDILKTIESNYQPITDSKWSNYVEETDTAVERIEETSENMLLGDAEVVLEIPKKRRKTYNNNFKKYPKVTTVDDENIQENKANATSMITIAVPNSNSIEPQETISVLQPNNLNVGEKSNNIKSNVKRTFVPPVINKNSKWAQFTEEAEESEQVDVEPSQSIGTSQSDLLFSLCDDTDLDNVLNI